MELFPASDDTQWELIKRVIEESDYYIVIVAGRYGSLSSGDLSYTEMEYDYAVEKGIPVLGFVRENVGDIPFNDTEKSEKSRRKLESFRQKVLVRTCRKYSNAPELGMAVMKSLMAEMRVRPRVGWIKADQARSDEDVQRERELHDELIEAEKHIKMLERTIRDRAILTEEIPQGRLAQGNDTLCITVTFTNKDKQVVSEDVELTWDEVFKVIGPMMYGYIHRKRESAYNQKQKYQFQDNLEEHIRSKIIGRVQNRKMSVESSQIDSCILQFKELGLVQFAENEKEDGKVFRGITLTEAGERRLTLLNMRLREPTDKDDTLVQPAHPRPRIRSRNASQGRVQ
jgi:hypothetical protein